MASASGFFSNFLDASDWTMASALLNPRKTLISAWIKEQCFLYTHYARFPSNLLRLSLNGQGDIYKARLLENECNHA
jgi:hypothetical protein